MNKAHSNLSARECREKRRRFNSIAHFLIIVVAMIECFVLLSFTTFSWIESSSSLIISSGKLGKDPMSVAKNITYQILLSADAGGNVSLVGNRDQSDLETLGVSRTLEHFSYAKATSPDGVHFFFKRPDSLGLTGAAAYRAADTTDFNTSYTYLDFVLKNTTGTNKGFYFSQDSSSSILSFKESVDGMNTVVLTDPVNLTAKDVILNAMRISFTNGIDTRVLSRSGNSSVSPVSAAHEAAPTGLSSSTFLSHEYSEEVENSTVFDSQSTDIENRISVRVWFEENDSGYTSLSSENKALVDSVLHSAVISLNFTLVNDRVSYGKLYFEDYAFSDTNLGKHVTRENTAYGMYFHAYSSKTGSFVNFPMTVTNSANADSVRWVTSIPVPSVASFLKSTEYSVTIDAVSYNPYDSAYFFYGVADDGVSTPALVAYKWSLPDVMGVADSDDDDEDDTILTSVVRNLGVVRTSGDSSVAVVANYVSGTTAEPVNGFLQYVGYDEGVETDPMTMVYFRDRATALTGADYNQDTLTSTGYNYITGSRSNVTGMTGITTDLSKVYYVDVPITATGISFNINGGGGTNQTDDISSFSDGTCFRLTGAESSNGHLAVEVDTSVTLPTAMSLGMYNYKRIYFNDSHATVHFAEPKLYNWPNSLAVFPGVEMNRVDAPSTTRYADRVYINRVETTGGGSTQSATARQTIQLYYDTANSLNLWKAYVPSSWLTSNGTYFHYNGHQPYYDDAGESVRWAAGTASQYNGSDYIYTTLGYTDNEKLDSLTGGAGVGTWLDVRPISFSTELIDSSINSAYVYKVGTGTQYPMAPVDSLYLTYQAYIPATADLASQSDLATAGSANALRFTRCASYSTAAANGYWYPQENITANVSVYYATDPDAASNVSTGASRGWFHVAVFVDGTFENLVYDTTLGTEAQTKSTGGYLAYSFNGTDYETVAYYSDTVAERKDIRRIAGDTTRWVIPMGGHTYVYFRWAPYPSADPLVPGTVFNYSFDITDGIYFVVTEAS